MTSERKRNPGGWLMALGALLLLAAGALTAYNRWDARRAAAAAEQVLVQLVPEIPARREEASVSLPGEMEKELEIPDHVLNPQMEMPVHKVDGNGYIGILEIPELQLSLPIISEWSYPSLKLAPCRYSGSAYENDLVIAGHNYKGHFARLSELSAGSEITFTDVDGNVFRYTVIEFETMAATAVEQMNGFDGGLTLFTCTKGGKSRFALRAEQTDG